MKKSSINYKIVIYSKQDDLNYLSTKLGVDATSYLTKGAKRYSGVGVHKENVWIFSSGYGCEHNIPENLILIIKNNIDLFKELKRQGNYLSLQVNIVNGDDQIGFVFEADELSLLGSAGLLLDVDCPE